MFTIQKFIDQHKVIFDRFFVKLSKIASSDIDNTITKLKDKSRIGIPFRDSYNIQVFVTDMKEGGRANSDNG